ncbi:hypothetical protein BV25DRAFT_351910 [Artomyces pyxidatus]|uniref:Uncharacterized protein n=2 Tax=Artomyces pyxidatus TaxID=48021 RepID=A0ACB8T6Q7_9AGAM|nr:hypothetical protein BV25DRAFT_975536 [Artomyces pyxidatus]KAI0064187.1 hypothetical protein BV25DRAFT_351910 [Artomyces pyxidatus]
MMRISPSLPGQRRPPLVPRVPHHPCPLSAHRPCTRSHLLSPVLSALLSLCRQYCSRCVHLLCRDPLLVIEPDARTSPGISRSAASLILDQKPSHHRPAFTTRSHSPPAQILSCSQCVAQDAVSPVFHIYQITA